MSPEALFTLVTGIVAVPKPYLITLIDYLWVRKNIPEREPHNAAIFLLNLVVGAIIAQAINWMGDFGLTALECLIIGTPSAFAGGQGGHRLIKYYKNGHNHGKRRKNGDTNSN